MVGAALTADGFAGLIADGIHVDPLTLRVAYPDGEPVVGLRIRLASTTQAVTFADEAFSATATTDIAITPRQMHTPIKRKKPNKTRLPPDCFLLLPLFFAGEAPVLWPPLLAVREDVGLCAPFCGGRRTSRFD